MRATLMRWAVALAEFGAQRSTALLVLILLAAGICSTLRAWIKPFWYDEICTVILCRLPNGAEIWKALDHAADTNPPVFYSVARAARQIVPEDHLGYRLPAILGLLGTVAGVYLFLLRRGDRLAALVGATFVLCTPLASYAAEARPYALMLCCITGAILAWQRIDDSKLYPVALAFTLAAAISLHYYAILVWPAFILAEASLSLVCRRFRVAAWAAICGGALPLLFFTGLLAKLRQYYGQNFWAQPHGKQVFSAYDWLFSFGGNWGWILVVIFAYWSLAKAGQVLDWRSAKPQNRQDPANSALPIQECMLINVLLWLPVIGVVVAKVGHGGMTNRYMMPTILGGAMAVGYVAGRLPIVARGLLLVLMLMNYGISSATDAKKVLKRTLLEPRTAAAAEMGGILARYRDPDLPIVISSGMKYLPMAYYTPIDSRRRLFAVTDPRASVKFAGTDSVDLALLVLRRYFPLQVEDFGEFASRHRQFLLLAGNGTEFDWWPARLSQDGYTLSLLPGTGETKLYIVTGRP